MATSKKDVTTETEDVREQKQNLQGEKSRETRPPPPRVEKVLSQREKGLRAGDETDEESDDGDPAGGDLTNR